MATPRALVIAVVIAATSGDAHADLAPVITPQQIWERAVTAAWPQIEVCSQISIGRGVYGDVVVQLDHRGRWTTSPSKSLGAHGRALAACVRQADFGVRCARALSSGR